MQINAVFTDKHTGEVRVLAFEASTQLEFNQALCAADGEAGESFRQFSRDVETLTGNDDTLATWEANYEPPGPDFQPIAAAPGAWANDHLQFARLLRELDGAGAFTPALVETLSEQMDCEEGAIEELLGRAHAAFEEYQSRNPQVPNCWKVVDSTDDEAGEYVEDPDFHADAEQARRAFRKLAETGRVVRLYSCHDDGEDLTEWDLEDMANQQKAISELQLV